MSIRVHACLRCVLVLHHEFLTRDAAVGSTIGPLPVPVSEILACGSVVKLIVEWQVAVIDLKHQQLH